MKKIVITYFCLLVLWACNDDVNNTSLSASLEKISNDLKQEIQKFSINTNQNEIITTNKGLSIIISDENFIYEGGQSVKEVIELSVIEYDYIDEYIKGGLETKTSNGLLETEGMLHIDAVVASGKKIIINPNKPINIISNIKGLKSSNPYALYQGEVIEGKVVWNTPKPSSEWSSIPYDVLFKYYSDKWYKNGIPDSIKKELFREYIESVDLAKYQNTWIATPEFEMRFHKLKHSFFLWDDFDNHKQRVDSLYKLILPLSNISIQKADKIIYQLLLKDSINYVHEFDYSYLSNKKDQIETRKSRASFAHKGIVNYKKSFVDKLVIFDKAETNIDTFFASILKQQGYYSPDYEALSEEKKKELKNMRIQYLPFCQIRDIHGLHQEYSSPINYTISRLGWSNVDKLLEVDYPKQEISLSVNRTAETFFYLFLKNRKIVINTIAKSGKAEISENLPPELAIVLAIQKNNSKLFFAKKEFKIGEINSIKFELTTINASDLSEELRGLRQISN